MRKRILVMLMVSSVANAQHGELNTDSMEVCQAATYQIEQAGLITGAELIGLEGVIIAINPKIWKNVPFAQKVVFGPLVACAMGRTDDKWTVGLVDMYTNKTIGVWTKITGLHLNDD